MPEIVGTFARTDRWDERANCSIEAGNSSRCDGAEEHLEFAVRQLDRIEVGGVCVQRRLVCLVGVKPTGGKVRSP